MNSFDKQNSGHKHTPFRVKGFTLLELMIVVAVIGILSMVAYPNYVRYIQRSNIADALSALSQYRLSMEQVSQDNGNYGITPSCNVAVPAETSHFTFACTTSTTATSTDSTVTKNAKQTFTATATGNGSMAGFVYTIDDKGTKATTKYAGATVSKSCWLIKPGDC